MTLPSASFRVSLCRGTELTGTKAGPCGPGRVLSNGTLSMVSSGKTGSGWQARPRCSPHAERGSPRRGGVVPRLTLFTVTLGECLPRTGPQFPFSSLDCELTECLTCILNRSELKVVCKVIPVSKMLGTQGTERAGLGGKFQLCRTPAGRTGLRDSAQQPGLRKFSVNGPPCARVKRRPLPLPNFEV